MKQIEKMMRRCGVVLCELFAAVTVVLLICRGEYDRLPLAIGTFGMVLLPAFAERLMHRKFPLPMYLYCLFYALGPMLGHCYKLYYRLRFWDKLLHISGGVLFALFGFYLYYKLGGDWSNRLLAGVFALLFSMGVAVCWEFVEFGADRFLGMDMQNDTVITEIHSYDLGGALGVLGNIEDIETVTINGEELPFSGYLDIGLIDTMMDMFLESCGALLTVLGFNFRQKKLIAKTASR